MPGLLSGSKRNSSGPSGYANITNVQYQLGPTPTTSTGYTLIADKDSKVTFVSSLGNLQFTSGTVYSNIPNQNIQFIGTGTGTVIVSGPQLNVSTNTGVLVVQGGVGIADGLYTGKDIHVNGLTIGQGYQGFNNIVIKGIATPIVQQQPDGENSIAIGYNTLNGIDTSLRTIAIGNYALSTGTYTVNTIAIGYNNLRSAGSLQAILVGSISNIETGSVTNVTINNHGLTTGTEITITGVAGTVELNNQHFLVDVKSVNTLTLYSIYDPNLTNPYPTVTPYVSGGQVFRSWITANNIGIGTNSAARFYQGVDNFFLGQNVASSFTTGSYNTFIGHEVVGNLTHGNFNISISGNQLVDGVDGQIGIGTVFYYNGGGYLQLDTNTGLGLGDDATDTTSTGALVVYGGISVDKSVYIGKNLNVQGSGDVILSPVGGEVTIEPQGGGTVTIYPESNYPGNIDNIFIGLHQARDAAFNDAKTQTLEVQSNNDSISTTTGALTVTGGVGIGGKMYVGGFENTTTDYTLYYNTQTHEVTFGPSAGQGQGGGFASTATNTDYLLVHNVDPTTVYYPALAKIIGGYTQIDADSNLNFNTTDEKLSVPKIAVTSTSSSTSIVTGALTVAGGVGIRGKIYSATGNPDENNLLYTPNITSSTTPPSNPRVGDVWIDLNNFAYYQWINDAGNRFWLQVTIL
jgi:hypothetical protein